MIDCSDRETQISTLPTLHVRLAGVSHASIACRGLRAPVGADYYARVPYRNTYLGTDT